MELVLRTAVVYLLLWAVIRATGKRELSELVPFDLVLLIVLGDVIQQAITQEDMSITGGLIVLATMGVIVVAVNDTDRGSGRARRFVEGHPTTIVRDGKVEEDALRIERLPIADLLEAARSKGIDDSRPCATRSSSRTAGSRSSPPKPPVVMVVTTPITSADAQGELNVRRTRR